MEVPDTAHMAEKVTVTVPVVQVARMRRFLFGIFRCTQVDDQGVTASESDPG